MKINILKDYYSNLGLYSNRPSLGLTDEERVIQEQGGAEAGRG